MVKWKLQNKAIIITLLYSRFSLSMADFDKAAEAVKSVSSSIDERNLRKLYGLFKQANAGDCSGSKENPARTISIFS